MLEKYVEVVARIMIAASAVVVLFLRGEECGGKGSKQEQKTKSRKENIYVEKRVSLDGASKTNGLKSILSYYNTREKYKYKERVK